MNYNDPSWSYKQHDADELSSFQLRRVPSTISQPETIDAWRHYRMLQPTLILSKFFPQSKWITIGDGNFGSDAYFLKQNSVDVLATSLNDLSLSLAKDRGYLEKYKSENAEKISFADDSFDFVLCKEAYHHFPRPAIAFYEMLRVCKKAMVLIEPHESSKKILDSAKDRFKQLIRNEESALFEPCGNFIFRINIKEIKKMMTSLNYKVMAVKLESDLFYPPLTQKKRSESFSFFLVKLGIFIQNLLGSLRILDFRLACVIIFKEDPSDSLLREIKKNGFKIISLPKNPFLAPEK